MEATAKRPALLKGTQTIVLVIVGVVVIWSLSPVSPLMAVLLAVAALFLLGLRRPVWAMAAFLVSQLTATSYMVNTPFDITVSLRLLLLLLIGLLLWRSFAQKRIELGPMARRVLIPAVILLAVSVIANLANSGFDFAFKDFRNMAVGLLIIILLPAVVRNTKDLKILCGVAFIGFTASAIIGLMQHYQFFGIAQNTLIPGFLEGSWEGGARVPGIAESELELAYTLSISLPAVLGIYLVRGMKTRWLLLLSAVPIGLALYFTYTRSALFALILGLVALALFLTTRIRGEVILAALLLGVGLIAATGILGEQYFGGRAESVQEESSISRQIVWQSGIAIAMDNPVLGIGGDKFSVVSPEYASEVDPSLLAWEQETYWGYESLGSTAVHNDFLGVWVCYGTLALVAYLWLYVVVLRNLLDSYRASTTRFIKGLSIGLAAALVAYGVNAFYHNLFATMPLFWILAGFSLATAKLALKRKGSIQISQADMGNLDSSKEK